jgi:5-formyltetrahydrofolate cyclo-ligase
LRPLDFDPATLDALKRHAKRQLRQRMRALRGAVPPEARARRSAAIFSRLSAWPEVASATSVALFGPMLDRGEVDLRELDGALRARGARVFYPRMSGTEGGAPGFARVSDPAELEEAGHGFLEPKKEAPAAAPGEIDLVIVPALAVAETGARLGYGSGFYDTVLPVFCPPALSLVVAFEFQLLAELPSTDGDVACDLVVTDGRTLRAPR